MSAPTGILIAVLVDIVLPLGLAALLIVRNWRRRKTSAGEGRFWIGVGIYLALVGFAIWRGIVDIYAYEGGGVIGSTIVALPTSLVPAVFNSYVIHFFFTTKEWATFGYFAVLTVYVSGMAVWALLNAVTLRALVTLGARTYEREERAARLREPRGRVVRGFEQLGLTSPSRGRRADGRPEDSVEG
jgi:hypothetical protein